MNDNIKRTKVVAIQISNEVDDHNDKLQDLDEGVERNTSGMVKTT